MGSAILGVGYTSCYVLQRKCEDASLDMGVKVRRDAELGKWYNTMVHEEHKQRRRRRATAP